MVPETRYARSGDVNIAYQVTGHGPIDLVFVMGWVSNLEAFWQEPSVAGFFNRLASFSRLILFDKRGTGLSDRVPIDRLPTIEQRMDDVRAVMDAAGSSRAALFGVSEGGPMCSVFAASFPQRTSALVMYGSYAKRVWDAEYPWAPRQEERESWYSLLEREWGSGADIEILAPNADDRFRDWWARYLRMSASPGAAVALGRMNTAIDIRQLLSAIRVPTLILHRTGDRDIDVGGSRWMARQIADAKYVELSGDDHLPWVGDQDAILDEVEEFLTGVRHGPDPDRVLATILFTDIVESTVRAAELGDRGWRDLLGQHNSVVRGELERFQGREIDNAGDGFYGLRRIGLEVRAGIHTGECEVLGDKLAGVAIHVAARIAATGGRGEVRVSGTVHDLVAGSGIAFQDLGPTALKGMPGEWGLFQVAA